MTRRFCLLLLSGVAAAQIVKPRIGYIVDRNGNLRPVEGVAGAFTLGAILERDVLSAAFSGRSLVVKRANEIRVDERAFEAPDGPAVVLFNAKGQCAEVFFPAAGVLWTWHDGEFISAPAYDVIADIYIREGELMVSGVPVRFARQARHVSQLGEGWLVVYADDCTYAVRDRQVFELPEDAGE